MGKSDNPFGSDPPRTDAFGRPISEGDDAFGSPAANDAFGPPAGRDDPFGSVPDLVKRPASGDAWRTAPPPGADDPWRTAPPPGADDPWRAAPPPDADDPPQPAPARTAETAVPALVLGLFGLFCQLLAPFAWALGRKAEREIDASGGALGGRGLATAGKILGIIGVVLLILGILLLVAGIVFGVSSIESSGPTTTIDIEPR